MRLWVRICNDSTDRVTAMEETFHRLLLGRVRPVVPADLSLQFPSDSIVVLHTHPRSHYSHCRIAKISPPYPDIFTICQQSFQLIPIIISTYAQRFSTYAKNDNNISKSMTASALELSSGFCEMYTSLLYPPSRNTSRFIAMNIRLRSGSSGRSASSEKSVSYLRPEFCAR